MKNIKKYLLVPLVIVLSILLIIPSIVYLVQNQTIMQFDTYYNFFINTNISKTISTTVYLILFIALTVTYMYIVKNNKIFKNIKQILIYVTIVSIIFLIMLPWTSSDIFYYMGVGELDSRYNQNPYYVTMKQYYEQNKENIDSQILEKGANNFWADTTVVYGPVAQLIFKLCTSISMKNIDICLIIFKILNLAIHILNCYLIYKICKKEKFAILYGLNPFILLEFIGNVHNDIIVVFFILLSLYFLLKKKNLLVSIIFLAIATGIKYFTVLLLPIIILQYFKNEKKISTRILKCFQYGIIFILILGLEYILYFRNFEILIAMFAQTEKYSKSMYSAMLQINPQFMMIVKSIIIILFICYYLKICIDLLTEKNIKFYKIIRKYNIALILFLAILTTFQQWYLIWLFATIMWQKPNTIKNIIGISAISEIANSIYMFKSEWYIYDIYFVGMIIILFISWQIITNKRREKIGKISFNRW